MAIYDRVLGSHLDVTGVADGARAEAQRLFYKAIENDEDLVAQDRLDRVAELAAIPGLRLALACEGEELERYLVIGHDGGVRTVMLANSRSFDRFDPPGAGARPEIRVRSELDAVIQRMQRGGAIDPIYDVGAAVAMPFRWTSREDMVRALVDIAPHLEATVWFIVEIDNRRHEIGIEHGRLRVAPLALFSAEGGPGYGEAFFELARMPLPGPEERTELVVRQRVAQTISSPPLRDPGRPFTTGTLEQRRASIAAAIAAKTKDFARLIAALQDPANADPRYDQVRRDLYRYLAAHDTREIAGLFLWALQEESEAVIETVTLLAHQQSALLAALPDLTEAAETRGDRRTAVRMRAALDEARR